MKKPRKPKPKRAHAQRHAGRGAAPVVAAGKLRTAQRRTLEPHRNVQKARAVSAGWTEEREKLALLLLPFFIMAFALGITQTLKPGPRLGDIAQSIPLASAPRLAYPRQAPSVPATIRIEDQLARTAMLELPRRAPLVDLPEVRPAHALRLPRVAPPVGPPEIRLAAPVMRLPGVPPDPGLPQVALAAPSMRLPLAPPDVPATRVAPVEIALVPPALRLPLAPPDVPATRVAPVEIALVPPALQLPPAPPDVPATRVGPVEIALAPPALQLPLAPPAVPAPQAAPVPPPAPVAAAPLAIPPPPALPPVAQRDDRPRPDICVASPTLGRHIYPAVARSEVAPSAEEFGQLVSDAAVAQTEGFVIYNDKYRRLAFPMGDVQPLFGVCTDVVIRAYRSAGVDLQELVHRARIGSGDPSIAHRRTETLRHFFAVHGRSLPVSPFAEDYQPGDIVTYHRPQNRRSRSHVAVVTDRIAPSGRPMIVHNRGWGPQLEDALFVDQITGHYRFAPARAAPVLEASRPTMKRAVTPPLSRALVKASFVPQLPAARADVR